MNNSIIYKKLAAPALVFALFFSILRYQTISFLHGFGPLIAHILLVVFLCYSQKVLDKAKKPLNFVFNAFILLFGIAYYTQQFYTLNVFDILSIWVCVISDLIYTFYDDRNWGFGKHIRTIFDTVAETLVEIPTPFKDIKENSVEEGDKKRLKIVIGVGISIPLLIVLTLLLVSADRIFGDMVEKLLEDINILAGFKVAFRMFFFFMLTYCGYTALSKGRANTVVEKAKPENDAMVGIIITGSIGVLYFIFSFVQIFGLFASKLTLPEGVSYAEYAREGFFQLLAVCIINLIIVLVCMWCFAQNRTLRCCLLVICVATYIMLASSAFRMCMYVGFYGLTRLRFSTFGGLLVIAVLLAWIIVSIYKKGFKLYRYGLITILTGYCALALCHMDYWIMLWNRFYQKG